MPPAQVCCLRYQRNDHLLHMDASSNTKLSISHLHISALSNLKNIRDEIIGKTVTANIYLILKDAKFLLYILFIKTSSFVH